MEEYKMWTVKMSKQQKVVLDLLGKEWVYNGNCLERIQMKTIKGN